MRNPTSGASSSSSSSRSRQLVATDTKSKSGTPCCSKVGLKRGPWTPEEDELLASYVRREGEGKWRTLPKQAGLLRCGKSCRLRWMNYLRPSVKRGQIAPDEEDMILRLHRLHTDGMVGSGGHHQAMELQRLINDDENAVVDDAYIADDDLLSSFLNSFLDEEEQQQIKGDITDGGICMEGIMDDDVVDLLAPSESLLGPLPALERRGF